MTTYSRVQLALAIAFGTLLAILVLLECADGRLTLLGHELAPLCHAETSPCASCGLTRGIVTLLDGNPAAATFHPAAPAATALLAFEVLLRLVLVRFPLPRRVSIAGGILDFVVHFVVARLVVNGEVPMP